MNESMSAFIWRTRKQQIVYSLLALVAVLAWMLRHRFLFTGCGLDVEFWSWLEPLMGMATLAAALAVWMGELIQDYDNGLPKRLTVVFKYRGRDLFVCHEAYLAAEGDIRPWAQQIGSQMAGTRQLSFEPFMTQSPREKLYRKGLTIMSYVVNFNLTELPVANKVGDTITNQDVLSNMHDKCLHWSWDEQQNAILKEWL